MKKIIYIFGGGLFSHVRMHNALAAMSFGGTARKLTKMFNSELEKQNLSNEYEVKTIFTKMADPQNSKLVTNEDVAEVIDKLIADPQTKAIILNAAMCDFDGQVGDIPSGEKAKRLSSRSKEDLVIKLTPKEKIINRIRKTRKDIFAVGFKTTDDDTATVQYQKGLKLMKDNSLNLVLVNDLVKMTNMIVVPEEATYRANNRNDSLELLASITIARMRNTFTRSTVVDGESIDWNSDEVPSNLRAVVNHCIEKGAYKPFQGKTVGHFAVKIADGIVYTSKRKTNFNELDKIGLVKIESKNENEVIAYGAKPSVGGQSQRIIFKDHPGMECIAHFHCPVKKDATHMLEIPVMPQWPNECGSHECGKNTSRGLRSFDMGDGDFIKVVYLEEHGPNIVFNKTINADKVIGFIDANFDLAAKTGGVFENVEHY